MFLEILALQRKKGLVLANSKEKAADQAFCLRKDEWKRSMNLKEATLFFAVVAFY